MVIIFTWINLRYSNWSINLSGFHVFDLFQNYLFYMFQYLFYMFKKDNNLLQLPIQEARFLRSHQPRVLKHNIHHHWYKLGFL
jgi:hypothetical protein